MRYQGDSCTDSNGIKTGCLLGSLDGGDKVFAAQYFDLSVYLKMLIIKYFGKWARGNTFP